MTHIRIESKMAELANATADEQEPTPFPTTTWEGDAELAEDNQPARLNAAFRYFNRVDERDDYRLAGIGYELPSLSVGDLLVLDGIAFKVAPVGFLKLIDPTD